MSSCEHLAAVTALPGDAAEACGACVAVGHSDWVHLRQCLVCGNVACCDSSPYQHATAHFHASTHPTMRSAEPGESWAWCYVDEVLG